MHLIVPWVDVKPVLPTVARDMLLDPCLYGGSEKA